MMLKVLVTICQICHHENVDSREDLEAGRTSPRCAGCSGRFGMIHPTTRQEIDRSREISEAMS